MEVGQFIGQFFCFRKGFFAGALPYQVVDFDEPRLCNTTGIQVGGDMARRDKQLRGSARIVLMDTLETGRAL